MEKRNYIKALRFNFLTPFYDFLISRFLREREWKSYLINSTTTSKVTNILDIGCGTATLTLMIEDKFKSATVIGLDGDPKILEIARQKINEKNKRVTLHEGYSTNIPFEDGRFELVFSSLMFHHLTSEDKRRTLSEVHRVLGVNGEILIADWGKPDSVFVRVLFLIVQFLDGFTTTKDNVKGLLPEYIKSAGFRGTIELNRFPTVLGSISIYKAKK